MSWSVTYTPDTNSGNSGTAVATWTGGAGFTYTAVIPQTDDGLAQFARAAFEAKNVALNTGPDTGNATAVSTQLTTLLNNLESSSVAQNAL